MRIRCVDFETTGTGGADAVVEVGWCDVVSVETGDALAWFTEAPESVLVNPGRPIPPEASAVHHIVDEDVADAVSIEVAFRRLNAPEVDIFAAHSVEFERRWFSGAGKPWICTLKAARRVWTDAPSHAAQVLRYALRLPVPRGIEPHRAKGDAMVSALLVAEMLNLGHTVPELIAWVREPALLATLHFGKYVGKRYSDVPSDYLDFLVTKARDIEPDVLFTARHHLRLRHGTPIEPKAKPSPAPTRPAARSAPVAGGLTQRGDGPVEDPSSPSFRF